MSDLRDRIARAIFTSREFAAAAAFGVPIDAKTVCAEGIADAVIAALEAAAPLDDVKED